MTNKWLLCFGNVCALNVSGRLIKYDQIYFYFSDHAEVSFHLPTQVSPAPTHLVMVSHVNSTDIGPVNQIKFSVKCDYFLIHQFKHVFWVLKRTVSLRRFF